MARNSIIIYKTHTLPFWEGFFICSEISYRMKKTLIIFIKSVDSHGIP
nr:MAG TPA: hypothetical protein [Caudoviricetes sp.]